MINTEFPFISSDLKRPLKEVNGSLRGLSAADRVEHRLKQLENEMKSERDAAARYANDSMQNLVRKSQAKCVHVECDLVINIELLKRKAVKCNCSLEI